MADALCQFFGGPGPAVVRERQGHQFVFCFRCVTRFAREIAEQQDREQAYTCAFCGRGQLYVRRLIVGPLGTAICDACTERAHSVVLELSPR
jgi:hypothetical protein